MAIRKNRVVRDSSQPGTVSRDDLRAAAEKVWGDRCHVHRDTVGGKKSSSKRELIEPHEGDKRYVRRDDEGKFKESNDVTKSLRQDVKKKAKTTVPSGQGDRGDQKRKVSGDSRYVRRDSSGRFSEAPVLRRKK